MNAYAPPRDMAAKIQRRLTQWRAARPDFVQASRPVLSITFDDFPRSAAEEGARVLEAHGVRGTFYASAGLRDAEGPSGRNYCSDDLLRLADSGHEIGCHGYSHRDAGQLEPSEALLDFAKNADALAAMGLATPLRTLAYPYGETRFSLKSALPDHIVAARGIMPGLNRGRVDRAHLRALPFFETSPSHQLERAFALAVRTNAWLIVFTHDVAKSPSPWGTSPKALAALIETAQRWSFTIAPVAEACARVFSGPTQWR